MEENRFFRLVWRFNGLVILVAGVLAIVIFLFVTYKFFQDVSRDRSVRNIVNIEKNAQIEEGWQLGRLSRISENEIMIPLHSDQTIT